MIRVIRSTWSHLRLDDRHSGSYISVTAELATIRELSEKQDEQRAMIGALLRGLARPGSHAAINNHGQPRYIGRSIAEQP